MTLTRPAAGQPLSNPSGPAVMDEYADAIEQAQADITAAQVDIAALEAGGASSGSPDVVYTDTFPDVAAVTLHSCDSLSDGTGVWVGSGLQTGTSVTLDTTNKTSGTGSVSAALNYPGGGGTDGKVYCNLAVAVSTTGHTELDVDTRYTKNGGATTQLNFEIVFASGVDLTGTVVTLGISGTENIWKTNVIPVGALTQVRSFGIRKKASATSGGGAGLNPIFKIDTPKLSATSAIDAALVTDDRAVVVPPSFVETVPQGAHILTSTQSVVDYRQSDANITRFRNVYSLRDRFLDETATTDISSDLQAFINILQPGDLLTAPPGAKYLMNGHIDIANPHITIDMQGAVFISTAHRAGSTGSPSMFSVSGDYVTLRNWRIVSRGLPIDTDNGSSLTNVVGTPVVVGTTKELRVINDEVRVPTNAANASNEKSLTPRYSRDEDGYIQFDLLLSQAAPAVASDAVVTILTHDGSEVQYTTTIPSIATTATVYPIKFRPSDLFARTRIQIKKTKAGTPIVVHSITGYRKYNYRTSQADPSQDFTLNAGILVGANYTTIQNYIGEGMGGDSIQCRAGNGVFIDGHLARGTGRENLVLTHGHDCEIRNFVWCGGARDTLDIEPESGDDVQIKDFTIRNGIIGPSFNIAIATSGPERIDGVLMEDIVIRTDTGGAWGGPSGMHNYTLRNITYIDERIDGVIGSIDLRGDDLTVENFTSDVPVNIMASNSVVKGVWVKKVFQDGSFNVTGPGCDVQDIRIGDPGVPFTIDPALGFNPVQLAADTTYRNIDVPAWKTELGNTYKANVATQIDWLPRGLDLKQSGARQIRGLSATTTPANNLRGLAQAVTAAATTATVAFPARTDVMNPPNLSLTASGPHTTKISSDDQVSVANSGYWGMTYNGQSTGKVISNATWAANVITFTTSTAHDVQVGDLVGTAGIVSTGAAGGSYNSFAYQNETVVAPPYWTVLSIPTPTTFTVSQPNGDPGTFSATGTPRLGLGSLATVPIVQRWLRALSTVGNNVTVSTDPTVGGTTLTSQKGLVLTWSGAFQDFPETLFSLDNNMTSYKHNPSHMYVDTLVTGGALTSGQWYVYRNAGRTFEGQPRNARTAAKLLLAAGANSITVQMNTGGNQMYDTTNDMKVVATTVWRAGPFGSDPGTYVGTYDKRVDLLPTSDFAHTGGGTDSGATFAGLPWVTLSPAATTADLNTDGSGWEADTNYGVWITPTWLTTVRVSAKRTGGFDVQFGTAAPGGATFDWILTR